MAGRPDEDGFARAREALIREVEAQVERYGTGDGAHALDPAVCAALRRVAREKFVPDLERAEAYVNHPLPIGHGQTISQPLIVALMTHHLQLRPGHHVLEIGTGSGYQTAVLAEIADDITTIETIKPLAEAARTTLEHQGYEGIRFIVGDGRAGAPENAPYDRIIVTAAAATLPATLIEQLAANGRLVAPIGESGAQQLMLLTKDGSGEVTRRTLFPVAFVPLT
ncbi:MAG: protein-L-isoaspartate(D-aspartate) O-methyltransferase [Alphaproteobacteria bacterium]